MKQSTAAWTRPTPFLNSIVKCAIGSKTCACPLLFPHHSPRTSSFHIIRHQISLQAIFLMTRCRRDLNLSALPTEMMIPAQLQPLLCIRFLPITHVRSPFVWLSDAFAERRVQTTDAPCFPSRGHGKNAKRTTRACGSRPCRRRICGARAASLSTR